MVQTPTTPSLVLLLLLPMLRAFGFRGGLSSRPILQRSVRLFSYKHPQNNVPDSITEKIGKNLHLIPNHPLSIIKKEIEDYCNNYAKQHTQPQFQIFDNLKPIVSTKQCFDDLRVEPTHVSRRPSDTYYIDPDTVLRTHTSAHQTQFISNGVEAFLCSGDVYRRDEIDASHYPVFHQMEGVRIYKNGNGTVDPKAIEHDLKDLLTGLARHLFGNVEIRWREDYFPFTQPSFELEVLFNEKWLEVLGCGVIHHEVLQNAGRPQDAGWAFGLGLERLAMVLFDIPDIRLFWSNDVRFLSQFQAGKLTKFKPFSKYPLCYKDMSFWLPEESGEKVFHPNDLYELIRDVAGDIAEKVEQFDEFTHPKTGRKSQAYRIVYRHMERSLTNEEVDEIQAQVRKLAEEKLKVTLR
eukprot:gene7973-8794_t